MASDKNPGNASPMANGNTNKYPGTSGSSGGTTAVTSVNYNDGKRTMAYGNSNNHSNDGQNILFCDGHVDWWTSPFAGRTRASSTYPFRDNIFTADGGTATPKSGTGSGDSLTSPPGDTCDMILLPTANSNGG